MDFLRGFLNSAGGDVIEGLYALLSGQVIWRKLNENLPYHELVFSTDDFWSEMVESGYLTRTDDTGNEDVDPGYTALRIPDKTVKAALIGDLVSYLFGGKETE